MFRLIVRRDQRLKSTVERYTETGNHTEEAQTNGRPQKTSFCPHFARRLFRGRCDHDICRSGLPANTARLTRLNSGLEHLDSRSAAYLDRSALLLWYKLYAKRHQQL